jgi:hypothetical protein
MLFEMIGLQKARKNSRQFTIHFDDNLQKFSFYEPSGLSLTDLTKLLDFFEIPHDSYRTGKELAIEPALFFTKILPDVLTYIQKLAPARLKPYQIASRPQLEAASLSKISNAFTPLFADTVLKNNTNDMLMDHIAGLSAQIILTTALLSEGSRNSEKSLGIIMKLSTFKQKVNDILTSTALSISNPEIATALNKGLAALSVYEKFNRLPAILTTRKFITELNEFTKGYQISSSACDIFEHTLLTMAEIKSIPESCHFDTSYRDATRVEFDIKGITAAEGNVLMEFLRTHGDDSVMTQDQVSGGYHARNTITEGVGYDHYTEDSTYTLKMNADGEVLYNQILPLFKAKILEMTATKPELLKPYQEKSAAYFTGEMKCQIKLLSRAIFIAISEEKLQGGEHVDLQNNLLGRLQELDKSLDCKDHLELAGTFKSLTDVWMLAKTKDGLTSTSDKMQELLQKIDKYHQHLSPPAQPSIEPEMQLSAASVASTETLFNRRDQLLALKKLNTSNENLRKLG